MRAGAGLSTVPDGRAAAVEAARSASGALGGARPSLAVLVASLHHAPRAREVLAGVHEAVGPESLIGCVAEAVVAGPREVEDEPAVAVWLASFPAPVRTFHMTFVRTGSGGVLAGWRFEDDAGSPTPPVHLLIADPFSFPADLLLEHLNRVAPGTVVVGGLASGASRPGAAVLFLDGEVLHEGAVGARLPDGVRVRTLVSQGCRPIGRSYVVTRARDNVVFELGGRPALERLRETVASLAAPDRELVSRGLHVGRVIDEYKAEHGTGDFVIRAVVGADPRTGALAVGDVLEVGQTVQFHVRDAATADEELRSLLQRELSSLPGRPSGALLFTCNGRGSRMFSTPDHDARLVSDHLGGVPLAGFFCAGELGPVGGRNFLHGFTASLAVFLDDGGSGES
jgi:small ligand-binding sensory domain FIST